LSAVPLAFAKLPLPVVIVREVLISSAASRELGLTGVPLIASPLNPVKLLWLITCFSVLSSSKMKYKVAVAVSLPEVESCTAVNTV